MSYDELDDQHGGASFLLGFLAGSVLGAGLALVLAPQAGKDMRRDVAERAQRLSKRAAHEYEHAHERVSHLAERGRDAYRTAADRAREFAERGRAEAHDAVDRVVDRAEAVADEVSRKVEAGAGAAAAKAKKGDLGDQLG